MLSDTGKISLASSTPESMRIADISYAGTALASSTTYYWRIKFWDDSDAEGAWGTATSTFSLAATAGTTTPGFVTVVQNISYQYDSVGNITQITDRSDTGAGKVVSYVYDDLYRLTSASTASASSTPYTQTYTYNSLGNLTAMVAAGATSTYTYAETGYTNPHAPTSVGGVTHTYDNNGNLSAAGTTGYLWDYRNRLTASGPTGATTTFAYDHTEQRVKKVSAGTTTIYPNKFYTIEGGVINKSIFAGGELIATIGLGSGGGGSTSTTTTHTLYANSTTWDNWSWGSTVDLNEAGVVYSGSNSIEVAYSQAWGGLYLRSASGVSTATSTHLQFAVRSPSAGAFLEVEVYGAGDTLLGGIEVNNYIPGGSLSANTWYLVNVPLEDLNADNTTFTGFVAMKDSTGTAYFDEVKLINVSSGGGSGTPTDTGFKTTGTVEVNTGWSNFTTARLNTSDNSRAACDSTCDNSDDAQTSDYNFGVPSGSTINGIEVQVEANEAVSSGNIPLNISLSWNDGSNFTSTKTATVDGTTDVTYTLGGSTDTWGRSWSVAELADGTFRARFDKSTSSDTLNIDYAHIKVYYTPPASGGGGATTTTFVHADHLGGTNVTTDETGAVAQVLDYYPYGDERLSTGSDTTDRHYIGERYDAETELSYLNARYYDSERGQFISQDPVHLAIGNWGQVQQLSGQDMSRYLSDPQQLNSYSYARNNPIVGKDPSGNATYIWNNGAGMTGIDTDDPSTYYQSADNAMLVNNASQVSGAGLIGGVNMFVNNVKPGGAWDYKTGNRSFYFFKNDLVGKEAFGNINYGYTGTAAGFGPSILEDAAGFVQVHKNTTYPNWGTNYDDPKDTMNIRQGINAYNGSGNSTVGARVTQAAYSAMSGQNISRIINSIHAVAKAFSNNSKKNR